MLSRQNLGSGQRCALRPILPFARKELADVLFNNSGEQVRNLTLGVTKIVRNGGVGEVLRMAQSNVHNIRRPAIAR